MESIGVAEAYEQRFQVVLARLHDQAAVKEHVVDDDLLLLDKLLQVIADRGEVLLEIVDILLEGHIDAGLPVLHGAVDDELHGEHGLATARTTSHKRRPALRQAAKGNILKPLDTGLGFLYRFQLVDLAIPFLAFLIPSPRLLAGNDNTIVLRIQ